MRHNFIEIHLENISQFKCEINLQSGCFTDSRQWQVFTGYLEGASVFACTLKKIKKNPSQFNQNADNLNA